MIRQLCADDTRLYARVRGGHMCFSIPDLPMQIYNMAPYAVTIIVLIFTSIRQPKERMAPKDLDVNFAGRTINDCSGMLSILMYIRSLNHGSADP
jgi:hypothetical protein